MKHGSIPVLHSTIIILLCLFIAGGFIYLSTRGLNEDVQTASQVVDMDNIYKMWEKPEYEMKQIDVSFQYDTRQVDDMAVVNYEITNEPGVNNITQREIDILLNCYEKDICDEIDISQKVEHIVENYKNFIIKDDLIIIYGLYPETEAESFGEIENVIFVINDEIFAKIVNPIYSKTNEKYDRLRKTFLIEHAGIDYSDFDNADRILQRDTMIMDAINEIKAEKTINVKDDIELLEVIAQTVEMAEQTSN